MHVHERVSHKRNIRLYFYCPVFSRRTHYPLTHGAVFLWGEWWQGKLTDWKGVCCMAQSPELCNGLTAGHLPKGHCQWWPCHPLWQRYPEQLPGSPRLRYQITLFNHLDCLEDWLFHSWHHLGNQKPPCFQLCWIQFQLPTCGMTKPVYSRVNCPFFFGHLSYTAWKHAKIMFENQRC